MSNNMRPSGNFLYRFIKRTFDIIFSAILMMPVGIVIGISALFIKKEDNGPIFYMANRIGRFGKTFKMFKLRSMKVDAPDIRLADGSTYNGDNDPRVTKFGKFARKTSLVEIPLLFKILKGDMTFIGPRPDTPMYLDKYTNEERIVLTVRPGITGYNQSVNRNSVLTKEKLKNDIYYVNHLSLWFDIKIIFMTVATVLGHKNVNRVDANVEDTYVLEKDGTKTEVK